MTPRMKSDGLYVAVQAGLKTRSRVGCVGLPAELEREGLEPGLVEHHPPCCAAQELRGARHRQQWCAAHDTAGDVAARGLWIRTRCRLRTSVRGDEHEHRHLDRLATDLQLKALGEERPQHEAELDDAWRGVPLDERLDLEEVPGAHASILGNPGDLELIDVVGEANQPAQLRQRDS